VTAGSRRAKRAPETLAIRHVAFEDLGLLEPLLRARGHAIRYAEAPVDDLAAIDPLGPELLIVLGGPIGVYESAAYPFIESERELLARRLAARRATLGICLGSQLIASALGARVYPSGVKELGWAPISLTPAGRDSCLQRLESTAVLHWHGDTFDLPAGATLLASTPRCLNQAFSWGDGSALALQFHAEATGRALERWFVGHTFEIGATPDVTVPQLRADTARWTPALLRHAEACFATWLDQRGV
jgi:GMP synthase (glutamine-hydrolysing)